VSPIPPLSAAARKPPAPLVLVADDDARVLELLQIALTNQQWRVVTASDGDEAIRRALAERPDVAVLDVRMPRKSGLEVCEYLRHDPEDPHVPIVLVSGTGDTDARLEGLSRGADDFLSKPFSPKELIARVQRLLARAGEARAQRRRSTELERELVRAQLEARRAQGEAQREQRLRELAFGAGRDLARVIDTDELADRILALAHRPAGGGAIALLAPDLETGSEGGYAVQAHRGEVGTRCREARIAAAGELAALLGGLGRPVTRAELERFPELRAELAPLSACGAGLLAPLRSTSGLEAVLIADERPDGAAFSGEDLEALGALCELASSALQNARRFRAAQDRAIELVAERAAPRERDRRAIAESCLLAETSARALRLPARERSLVRHAVALGSWGWGQPGRAAVDSLRRDDPTHRLARLQALVAAGESLDLDDGAPLEERRSVVLTAACVRFAMMRAAGRSTFESWTTALSWTGAAADPAVADALIHAFKNLEAPAGPPAHQAA
jgi:DNA-binding response OmpR family regulator